MYGSEVQPIGEIHCKKLRTALSTALLGSSQTRNAALAILAVPNMADPQIELVLRAMRTAKRFCRRLPSDQFEQIKSIASRHTGLSYQCRGPAGCLVYYLAKLGWSFTHDACIQITPQIALPLLTTNAKGFATWAL